LSKEKYDNKVGYCKQYCFKQRWVRDRTMPIKAQGRWARAPLAIITLTVAKRLN